MLPIRVSPKNKIQLLFGSLALMWTLTPTISLGESTEATVNPHNFSAIITLASEHDSQWSAAQFEHKANKQRLKKARSSFLPNISLSAESSRTLTDLTGVPADQDRHIPSENSESYSASLTQSIYHGDEWYAWKGAKAFDHQLDYQLTNDKQEFWLRVAGQYFEVLKSEAELAFREAEKAAIARQLDQTQQKFEVGLIAVTDVHEAKAAYDLSLADLLLTQNELVINEEILSTSIGQSLTGGKTVASDFLPTELSLPIKEWLLLAEDQNAALNIARLNKDIAYYSKKSELLAFGPSLDLIASYRSNPASQFGQSGEIVTRKVGLQLVIPIYQGGLQRANYREATFNYEKSQSELAFQYKQIKQNTTTLFRQLTTDRLRVSARKQAIVSATSALEATQAGYDVGTRNIVDLLDAQRRLFSAQRDLTHSQLDYLLHYLEFKQAVGELDDSALAQLDEWMRQPITFSIN